MTDEVISVSATPIAATPVPSAPVAAPAESASPAITQNITNLEAINPTTESTVLGTDESASDVNTETPAELKTEVKADIKSDIKADIEAKPEDNKQSDGAEKQPDVKDKEASQSDEPAPLPTFEPWAFPEGITVDTAQIGEINKIFGEFENSTKVDHKVLQGLGQQLIDRHISGVQAATDNLAAAYEKVWKDQTKSWFEAFVKDPEIGGNRQATTTAAAREFIRKHGGTPEQQAEIRTLMQKTGIGNHPAVIRLFAKATANLSEGKPIPASAPPSAPQSRKNKFYGSKS